MQKKRHKVQHIQDLSATVGYGEVRLRPDVVMGCVKTRAARALMSKGTAGFSEVGYWLDAAVSDIRPLNFRSARLVPLHSFESEGESLYMVRRVLYRFQDWIGRFE